VQVFEEEHKGADFEQLEEAIHCTQAPFDKLQTGFEGNAVLQARSFVHDVQI